MLKGLFSLAWSEGTTRLVPASGNRNEGLLLLLGLLLCRSLFLGLALLGLLCLFLRCHSYLLVTGSTQQAPLFTGKPHRPTTCLCYSEDCAELSNEKCHFGKLFLFVFSFNPGIFAGLKCRSRFVRDSSSRSFCFGTDAVGFFGRRRVRASVSGDRRRACREIVRDVRAAPRCVAADCTSPFFRRDRRCRF